MLNSNLSVSTQRRLNYLTGQRLLTYELARRRTLEFCQVTKPGWMTAKHHRLLCDMADKVIAGQTPRLMVSLPPRHTKSEIFSIRMIARYLGVYPERQVLHISYASALSNEFSRQIRALIRDSSVYRELFPRTRLDADRQRLDDWKTTLGGGMKSIGVGGGISGHGAHLIVIDDPVKEGDEQSLTTLDQIYDWYVSAARTRLAPGGAICLVMTRWHPSDLVGRLLDLALTDKLADQWQQVVLPAIANQTDVLGRGAGEALWPERYDVPALLSIRSTSPRYFQSLYQQDPQPQETKLFFADSFQRTRMPDEIYRGGGVWTVDLAISDKESADFSAWGRWTYDRHSRCYYVSKIRQVRQEWPSTKAELILLLMAYPDDIVVFPEQTYELMAVQELKASRPEFAGRIRSIKTRGDKRARAAAFADVVMSGRAFVEIGDVGDAFVREHDRFPDRHDDLVDMASLAVEWFGSDQPFDALLSWDKKPPPPRELSTTAIGDYWRKIYGIKP